MEWSTQDESQPPAPPESSGSVHMASSKLHRPSTAGQSSQSASLGRGVSPQATAFPLARVPAGTGKAGGVLAPEGEVDVRKPASRSDLNPSEMCAASPEPQSGLVEKSKTVLQVCLESQSTSAAGAVVGNAGIRSSEILQDVSSAALEEESQISMNTEPSVVLKSEPIDVKSGPVDMPAVVESQTREGAAHLASSSGVKVVKLVWTGKTSSSAGANSLRTAQGSSDLAASANSKNPQNVTVKLPPGMKKILTQAPHPSASKFLPSTGAQYRVSLPSTNSTRTVVVKPTPIPIKIPPHTVSLTSAISPGQQSGVVVTKTAASSAQVKTVTPTIRQVRTSLPGTVIPVSIGASGQMLLQHPKVVSVPFTGQRMSSVQSRVSPSQTSIVTLAVKEQPLSSSLIGQPQVLRPVSVVSTIPVGSQSGPAAMARNSSQTILVKVPASTSSSTASSCLSTGSSRKVVSPLSTDTAQTAVTRASVSLSAGSLTSATPKNTPSVSTLSASCASSSSSPVLVPVSELRSEENAIESIIPRSHLAKESPCVVSAEEQSRSEKVPSVKCKVEQPSPVGQSSKLPRSADPGTEVLKIVEVPQVDSQSVSGQNVVTIIAHSQEEALKQIQKKIGGANSNEHMPVIIIEHVDQSVEEERQSSAGEQSGAAFQCEECDYSSHNKYYLRQHTALVHSTERPYKCPFCDYAGKRSHSLREHLVVHSKERPFECHHCNATFRKKGHLTNHVKLHTSTQLAASAGFRYQCPHCSFVSDLEGLAEHSKQHKFTLTPVEEEQNVGMTPQGSEVKPVLVKCSVCGCTTATMDAMRAHMWEHISSMPEAEGVEQNSGERSVQSVSMTSIMNQPLPENAAFKCSECSFVSREASVFIKHMLSHKAKHSQELQQKRNQDQLQQQQQEPQLPAEDPQAQTKQNKEQVASRQQETGNCREPDDGNLLGRVAETASKSNLVAQSEKVVSGKENTCKNADNTPFVHDPVTKRFRCTLCGYTCEYQRTIKAHIWKHSGNKDINYPMFQNGPLSVYDDIPTDRLASTSHPADSARSHPSIVRILNAAPAYTSRPSSLLGTHHVSSKVSIQAVPVKAVYTSAGDLSVLGTVSAGQVVSLDPGQLVTCQSVLKGSHVVQCQPITRTVPSVHEVTKYDPLRTPSESCANVSTAAAIPSAAASTTGTKSTFVTSVLTASEKEQSNFDGHCGSPANAAKTACIESSKASIKTGQESSNVNSVSKQTEEVIKGYSAPCQNKSSVEVPSSVAVDSEQDGDNSTVVKLHQPEGRKAESDQDLGSPSSSTEDASPGLEVVIEASDSLDSDFGGPELLGTSKKVVVEAVDSVGSDFTGLRSQQSSPRQSEPIPSEDSGIISDAASPPKHPVAAEVSDANITLAANAHAKDAGKSEKADNALALLFLQKKGGKGQLSLKSAKDTTNSVNGKGPSNSEAKSQEGVKGSGEDKPKTGGICSSLLAVIEQLRERSVSESDNDLLTPGSRKPSSRSTRSRRGRGRVSGPGEDIPLEAVENIERLESPDGGETFRCRLCHYTSPRALFIRLHMRLHKSKQPSECSLCEYSAPSSEALQDHMIQHCKVRTYQCKFCSSAFNYKSQLRAHMRAHIEREPHNCQVCGFRASSPATLRQHMRQHVSHRHEGEEEGLEEEDEENEELRCPHCDFAAVSMVQLTAHASIHTQSEPLRCRECDFTAVSSRSLKSHMKRHTNDQRYIQQPLEQYKCNLCGYVCHHLPSLKSHMWRHASDKNYSYEFTNDIINAAIDYDWRQDPNDPPSETELLERVLTTERKITEGSLGSSKPVCWVTFRCCQCGFETINKPTLNIHMRSHSDIIQQTFDVLKPASPKQPGKRPVDKVSVDAPQAKLMKLQAL